MSKESKFKIGDIISPIKGKKSSNDLMLENLISLEVQYIAAPNYGKISIKCKILKGCCVSRYGSRYRVNNSIYIYDDAFELAAPAEPEYDIY